jgi:hypothetical protein
MCGECSVAGKRRRSDGPMGSSASRKTPCTNHYRSPLRNSGGLPLYTGKTDVLLWISRREEENLGDDGEGT